MRETIDEILALVGASSLTDEEFEALPIEDVSNDSATYLAIFAVLEARESVSDAQARLRHYYLAKGATIDSEPETATTQIFVGGVL